MPPRFVYWTILIDNKPTAFRAQKKEDLLPTLAQLRRTNADVVMKWFARGRIWDSPEAERDAQRRPPVSAEKRGRDWRPGGMHKDPRDRFRKKDRPTDRERGPQARQAAGSAPPWAKPKPPFGKPRGDRPWSRKPPSFAPRGDGPPRGDRPWHNKPGKPGGKPFGKPQGPRREWSGKPPGGPPRSDRPWHQKPRGPQGHSGRPLLPGRQRPKKEDEDK